MIPAMVCAGWTVFVRNTVHYSVFFVVSVITAFAANQDEGVSSEMEPQKMKNTEKTIAGFLTCNGHSHMPVSAVGTERGE